MQRTEKTENAPRLYDLTALQREANRSLGYTAQQTLDYLQALYEKKLCTYPRTDSRFLTDDLETSVPELAAVAAVICEAAVPGRVNAGQVCDSKKVSDHHAILPTAGAGKADVSVLPLGERELLRLVAGQLLRAVSDAHRYAETTVTLECGGTEFTAKGKTVLDTGWKQYLAQEKQDAALSALSEGQVLDCAEAAVKEGKITPPKHFTEDTLLAAMETAGREEMPEAAERKGLGTPATRAAIIEKLVATGFVERKRAKKAVSLVPAHTGVSLITVLPEFRASLDTIGKTANGIITDVEKHFAEVCKERGVELPKDTEYELVTIPPSRADALAFAADYAAFLRRDLNAPDSAEGPTAASVADRLLAGEDAELRKELAELVKLADEIGIDDGSHGLLERFGRGMYRRSVFH